MAIYKPSNLQPNLEEIDITENNTFSCQINTSGESAMAYKYEIINNNTEIKAYESEGINLDTPIKNKGILEIPNVSSALSENLVNGKDYQWGIRVYDAPISSQEQPITKVCTGYLVGSTRYVIWTKNNEQLEYDRYIEFETTGSSQIMPILEPNEDNLVLPGDGETFRERLKIDWVEKDLGWNGDITKIECVDNFTYNYINDTPFKIYLCGDNHTYSSVYADPNDAIEQSYFIVIYENESDANKAHTAGDTPDKVTVTPRETARRIIGYSEETGEIRVQVPFEKIPENGNAYLLFEYDRVNEEYTEITSDASNIVGGTPIEDESFKVITNLWTDSTKQLFIQPNINIKSDETNPNEIVFDDAGQRIDIIKTTSSTIVPGKETDITFEKLDNTQWLLHYMTSVNNAVPPIIPGSTYTVYTDFMDSAPYSVIYARSTPDISITYKNLNDEASSYITIEAETSKPWRDISFKGNWSSPDRTQVKYYQFTLFDYNGDVIAQSNETYDSELTYFFRGFQTSDYENVPVRYSVELRVVDEYDAEFVVQNDFLIFYVTEEGIIPLFVEQDCEEQALKIEVHTPVYVLSTNKNGQPTVTNDNLVDNESYLHIPNGYILNYTTVNNINQDPIIISSSFSYITQFRITGNFLDIIPPGGSTTLTEIAHRRNDTKDNTEFDYFTLKMFDFSSFFYNEETGVIEPNEDRFKLKWFKNGSDTPLMCFAGGIRDCFDISVEDVFQGWANPSEFYYTLQPEENYIFVETFPNEPMEDIDYVLTQDINYNQTNYYAGIYNWKNNQWVPNTTAEYLFIENISQVQDSTYDSLEVPENARVNDGSGVVLFEEEGNVWLDNGEYSDKINKDLLNNRWFMVYLVVNNTSDTEVVRSTIEINIERI